MKAWLVVLCLALASGPPSNPAPAADRARPTSPSTAPGRFLEALRYNVRERTDHAIGELERGDASAAASSLETARRLAPESPSVLYNLGTGHLHAADPRAVAELETALEVARETGPVPLVADAAYNLGNARFAASDFQGAIEAYKQSLRSDSADVDAKHNLELALRKLEEQEQRQQQSDSSSDSDRDGDEGESGDQPSPAGDEGSEEESPASGDQENQEQGGEPDPSENEDEQKRNPLPQFEEQPEMTAEQAAAILEAVDNLERQQRQEEARERARPVPVGGKDW